jgi:hypothetical protein
LKERIYTIPVTEAFRQDCECPICLLEEKLEDDALECTLGPSMMESDSRIETNRKGFCNRHFTKLYNMQKNRLALGLVIDTHLIEQNEIIRKMTEKSLPLLKKEAMASTMERISGSLKKDRNETVQFINSMVEKLSSIEKTCTICEKIDRNMDKFIDVILYLFFKEPDFKDLFMAKKGFCLPHLKRLLEGSLEYLNRRNRSEFVIALMSMQLVHMERIREEVYWFTQKFDYKNKDAPWGNSQDAIPRSIRKIAGPSDLIR